MSSISATPPVLPNILKTDPKLGVDDAKVMVEERLRNAMKVLVSRALVTRAAQTHHVLEDHEPDDVYRYRMHPVVHKWLRDRPQAFDSLAEEWVTCQYSITILSRAIRLVEAEPELQELNMRREAKPHIDQARDLIEDIQARTRKIQSERSSWERSYKSFLSGGLADVNSFFGPQQVGESARFGKVYLECGSFDVAHRLIGQVHTFLIARLGHDHPLSHRAKLALSGTSHHLTQWNDATKILRQVYESQKRTLGEGHFRTVDSCLQLAANVLSQGRITESRDLCLTALQGSKNIYGTKHSKTFNCINQLGRVYFYYTDYTQSLAYHKEAFEGMERLPEDKAASEPDILSCKQDYAMALIRIVPNRGGLDVAANAQQALNMAEEMMLDVVARFTKTTGQDGPYTLLARAQLGRAIAAKGNLDEAEHIMTEALEVAVRNHGHDNLAVMAGKAWFAQVLMQKGQLLRAEQYLRQITDKAKYAKAAYDDGEHPDRIMAVWYLVECLERQGRTKLPEALQLCEELQIDIVNIGGHNLGPGHVFYGKLLNKVLDLKRVLGPV